MEWKGIAGGGLLFLLTVNVLVCGSFLQEHLFGLIFGFIRELDYNCADVSLWFFGMVLYWIVLIDHERSVDLLILDTNLRV